MKPTDHVALGLLTDGALWDEHLFVTEYDQLKKSVEEFTCYAIGCGAGWMEEEFIAVGAPSFAERGKSTDEYLEIFREIWTKETPSYDGTYASFGNIAALPQPKQSPLPIWIGGESRPALRRTAKYGDGWYPIGYNPKFPLDTLGRFKKRLSSLHEEAEKVGRDPASISLAYNSTWYTGPSEAVDIEGERRLFTGGTAAVKEDLAALAEIGVETFMFRFAGMFAVGATVAPASLAAVEWEAARLFMIDMYPGGPLERADFASGDPFAEAGFADRVPLLEDSPARGPFSDQPTWTSALRHRLIPGARAELFVAQKIALLRYHPFMRLSAGLHYVGGVRLARRELLLGHFKYNAEFRRKAEVEAARGQHWDNAEEYRKYLALLSEGRSVIFDPGVSLPWQEVPFVAARLD